MDNKQKPPFKERFQTMWEDPEKKKKFLIISSIIVGLFLGFIVYIWWGLPSLEELENPKPQLASKVYSIDGELIGQYYVENRIETDIDSLPPHLVNALISTEDRKFYDHWGVDMDRFVKAMVKNIFKNSREGASTLTQQLSKNLYNLKSSNENIFGTGIRKIREWITAIQIEKTFTKREILEMYFNVSYFGKSAYGIESAARVYFNKKGKDLTIPESAMLIALLKSPVQYDPERRVQNALTRRNLVMQNMVTAGFLTEDKYERLKNEPIVLARGKKVKIRSDAPHFMESIRQQMEAVAEKHGLDLYRDGLSIYTTLDHRMQVIANKVVAAHLKEYQEIFYKNWKWDNNKELIPSLVDRAIKNTAEYHEAKTKEQKSQVYNRLQYSQAFIDSVKKAESTIQVGFVVIDPTNGQIRAMVGGANQDWSYGINHVTQIRRQPGSSFKPIVYTVAMDNGAFPAYSLSNTKFNYNGWSPSNSDGSYGGYMTLRNALAQSVNVIAGRLTTSDMAPPSQVVRYAKKMGVNSPLSAFPSIALGTIEIAPIEEAAAFATLANHGVYHAPISVLRVEDRNGMVLEEYKSETWEAVSPQSAALTVSMMEDVVSYGTGASVRRVFHRPAAGKTGTTQDYADAWFSGFTPQLEGTVWVGFDDHRIKFNGWYGQGARAALPIWANFMAETYNTVNLPLKYFDMPDGVVQAEFCKASIERGETRLAKDGCPEKVTDWVKADRLPEACNIHGGGARTPAASRNETGW